MTTPTLKCPRCQADNDRNYRTCANCGTARAIDPTDAPKPALSAPAPSVPSPSPAPAAPTRPPAAVRPTVPTPPVPSRAPLAAPSTRFAPDITRYLCTAVHTDTRFARRAVEQIVEEPRRAVASSPGVDLGCVLRHALAARRRQVGRDVLLAVLLLIVVIMLPITFGTAIILGWLVAWVIVAVESLSVHYGVVSKQLSRENFAPDKAPQPAGAENRRRIEEIERRDRGNVVVSSMYTPFVGYGQTTSTWSFALDTARPQEGKQVVPFTVHDLNDHLAARVGDLKLPGVHVENLLLVNGKDLQYEVDERTRSELLADPAGPPAARASTDLLHELREDGKGRARPYLAIRVTGWSGELAITFFLRCALLSDRKMLFIEGSSSLLAPVRERYRIADRLLDSPTFRQWWALVAQAGLRAPLLLVGSPFSVIAGLFSPFIQHGKQRRQAQEIRHRAFDYGASFSIRDAASDKLYYRYFQQLDRELYAKTVEHRVLDALVEFMEEHDIDTNELMQRQTTIYNTGLYAGGDVNVHGSAVGVGGSVAGVFRRGQAAGAAGQPAQAGQPAAAPPANRGR
ncbi:zinc ribbon domain-containing protein [Streptomyces sp. NPDC001928]|uniref:zinc ribbon domain-containing protein n=1 Tax=Streptomyces sp. NPDC001928 TaxID=3154404 RepID=UPI00331A74F0